MTRRITDIDLTDLLAPALEGKLRHNHNNPRGRQWEIPHDNTWTPVRTIEAWTQHVVPALQVLYQPEWGTTLTAVSNRMQAVMSMLTTYSQVNPALGPEPQPRYLPRDSNSLS